MRARNLAGDSALHAAAGYELCFDALLRDHDLPVNQLNAKLQTPLHCAAMSGSADSIQALLQAGAAPNVQDTDGNTPLHLAFSSYELRPDLEFPVFHALVEAGADRSIRNNNGKTAFDLGIEWKYPEEYLRLLDPLANADPATFIWLGTERLKDLHPAALTSFKLDGKTWPSALHYFHAQKTEDENIRERIRKAKTSSDAACRLRESKTAVPADWSQRCDDVVRGALMAKFKQNESLRQMLLGTGEAILVSDSDCNVWYWIERPGVDFNQIGKLLMTVRNELRNESNSDR